MAGRVADLACGAAWGILGLYALDNRDYYAAAAMGMWVVAGLWVQETRVNRDKNL